MVLRQLLQFCEKTSLRLPKAKTFIWIMCLAVTVDVGARVCFQRPELISQQLNHLSDYFKSSEHPDLMVLGSSVALGSSFKSDAMAGFVDDTKVHDKNYVGACYLQKLLKERAGLNLNCMTAASIGAMASDSWLTVSKAVEFKKAPKVIVYEFVSRDFFDASVPELGSTPTFKMLAACHPSQSGLGMMAPLRGVIDWTLCSPFVTAGSIILSDARFLTDPERFNFSVDSLASVTSFAYKNRRDFKEWLAERTCQVFNRKSTLREAVMQQMIAQKKEDPFGAFSVGSAKTFDTSAQERRFENEIVYYEKLLKLCQDNSIKLIVVNMPVRRDYLPKVPDALKSRFPGEVFSLARRYGADVIDMQAGNAFADTDFKDLIHMTKKGCVKFVDLLSLKMSKNQMVSRLSPKTY